MNLPTYVDRNPVARIDIDAEGLEWLCEQLPSENMFTIELKELRTRAQVYLWNLIVEGS